MSPLTAWIVNFNNVNLGLKQIQTFWWNCQDNLLRIWWGGKDGEKIRKCSGHRGKFPEPHCNCWIRSASRETPFLWENDENSKYKSQSRTTFLELFCWLVVSQSFDERTACQGTPFPELSSQGDRRERQDGWDRRVQAPGGPSPPSQVSVSAPERNIIWSYRGKWHLHNECFIFMSSDYL